MNTSLFVERLRNWGIRGSLSILDHGLYSGANFVLSVLLARWLLPSHYGVYSIAFAIYQFAYQAHNAVILEPMSVLGPAKMYEKLTDYLGNQIKLHFVFSFFASLTICIVGLIVFVFNQILGIVLIIMSMVLSFILLPLLMRRGFYIFRKPEYALFGSVIYAVILGGGLLATRILADVSVQLAFPLIGFAGLVSGFYLIRQIPPKQSTAIPIIATLSDNWEYGRWLLYSSFLIALAAQAQTFVVGSFLGLSDAGAFRALQNFIQPIILLFTAVSAFLLPSLSYDFGKGDIVRLKRKGKYMFALFLVVSVGFEVFLLIFATPLESVLYEGRFSSYVYLIPLWGLAPIAAVLTYVYYFLLQSIQHPKAILIGSLGWSGTSLILSLILSLQWGIAGATISVVIGYLISGIIFAYLYYSYMSTLERKRST
jgi:O-antigen/teichoic acid export membrane protein